MVERIKELCKANGITVAELERRCGIGNGIIARWKTSKPSYERLSIVAKELGTSVEYLQTGVEQKEKPAPISESELSPVRKEALDFVMNMDEETLIRFIKAAKAMLGE